MIFTDTQARRWDVIDYRVVAGKKKRLALGDPNAEGRAFVPDGWTGAVMLYRFGSVAYRTTDPKILADQLRLAKPVNANAAERMNG